MNRFFNIAVSAIILILVSCVSANARSKSKVWHNPDASQNIETYFSGLRLNVSDVELNPDETIVRLYMRMLRPGITFKILPSTVLKSNGKEYVLRMVGGNESDSSLNKTISTGDSLVLHFEPLAEDCTSFDLHGGDEPMDIRVTGIAPRSTTLHESCWRDEKTGDWVIGFFAEGVVYDSRLWTYISRDDQAGKYIVTDGNDTVDIEAREEINGKRMFRIGERPMVSLSRIMGNTLPPYPQKEYRKAFDNTNYQKEDSVIISGWVRGLPELVARHRGKDINVYYTNVFTGQQEKISVGMDSTGRFSLVFPIPNTTLVMLDTKSCTLSFPVEPGKEYFILEDYAERRRLVMGDDTRIQNEIISYEFPFLTPRAEVMNVSYIERVDKWQNEIDRAIDNLARNNPTLSDLFIDYLNKKAILEMASAFVQTCSSDQNDVLLPDLKAYFCDNFWSRLPAQVNAYSGSGVSLINNVIEKIHSMAYGIPIKMANGKKAFLLVPDELTETLSEDIKLIRADSSIADQFPADSVSNVLKRVSVQVREFL